MRTRIVVTVSVVALVVVAVAAFFLVRGRGGQSTIPTRDLGSVRVGVDNRPGNFTVGDNRLVVRVEDDKGKPVRGAELDAVIYMPAMGSMPYMESRPKLQATAPGVYEGEYHLVMGGSWDVNLAIKPPEKPPVAAGLRLTVGTPGFTWVTEGAGEAAADTAMGAAVTLSARRRQEIGVVVEPIGRRDLTQRRRTTGRVAYDETRTVEVTVKYPGWVRRLTADFTGEPVRRGQTLFTVYSPELYAAEREFVQALAAADSLPAGAGKQRALELADAARRRLALWDLSSAQIEQLARTRKPGETVTVASPVSGVVLEKSIFEGSSLMPGQVLFRIAPLNPVWVMTDVFQNELAVLRVGQTAAVQVPGSPTELRGRVTYVYPSINPESRTGQVRVEVPNPGLVLKPDMFVDVELQIPFGERLAVPASAVIHSGTRRVVFVDRGEGRLEPRQVELGPRAGDWYAVESGLAEGDRVVTSGNFLISAESRLRSASSKW